MRKKFLGKFYYTKTFEFADVFNFQTFGWSNTAGMFADNNNNNNNNDNNNYQHNYNFPDIILGTCGVLIASVFFYENDKV